MKQKFSRQRRVLLSELCSRTDHPTAEMLYEAVRGTIPNISLGTVYRNLSQFSDEGTILRISTEKSDRFDGNTQPHYHFTCTQCGQVLDVQMPVSKESEHAASMALNAQVTGHKTMFYGVCHSCCQQAQALEKLITNDTED